jgi:hypothetical protein
VTGAVIVTTPQDVALMDVYKSVSMCQKMNVDILGVVENMSFFIDSAGVRTRSSAAAAARASRSSPRPRCSGRSRSTRWCASGATKPPSEIAEAISRN